MISATGRRSFTFLELLFVIAIIAILAAASIPSFRKTFNGLQLNSSAFGLQSFINYLSQRSVAEGQTVYLNINGNNGEFTAQVKGEERIFKNFRLPSGIRVETDKNKVIFYPDGSMDKTTIKLISQDNRIATMTSKGVLNGVKIQPE